ncbi:MAG: TetR/AcrR family transcriptional regulator [Syntrophomonadales bacterium]
MNRKDEILAVAAKLFREHGYDATTLENITDQIGISEPAIYYYFNSKEDILYEICRQQTTHYLNQALTIAMSKLDLPEKVSKVIEAHILDFDAHRDRAEAYLREAAYLPIERRKEIYVIGNTFESVLRELVEKGIKEGVFRPLNSKIIVRGITGLCSWVGNWYYPDGPLDIHEIAAIYIDFLLPGLLADDPEIDDTTFPV